MNLPFKIYKKFNIVWSIVVNGGFGLVIDGSDDAENNARSLLAWYVLYLNFIDILINFNWIRDVSNGVARRCWSGNSNAKQTIIRTMDASNDLQITLPNHVNMDTIFD